MVQWSTVHERVRKFRQRGEIFLRHANEFAMIENTHKLEGLSAEMRGGGTNAQLEVSRRDGKPVFLRFKKAMPIRCQEPGPYFRESIKAAPQGHLSDYPTTQPSNQPAGESLSPEIVSECPTIPPKRIECGESRARCPRHEMLDPGRHSSVTGAREIEACAKQDRGIADGRGVCGLFYQLPTSCFMYSSVLGGAQERRSVDREMEKGKAGARNWNFKCADIGGKTPARFRRYDGKLGLL